MSNHLGFLIRNTQDNMYYHRWIGWTNKPLMATVFATEEAADFVISEFERDGLVVDMIVAKVIVRPPKEEIQ